MAARWTRCAAVLAAVLTAWGLGPAAAVAARAKSDISGKGSAVRETALGDLVADAVRAAAKADAALVPAFWLREVSLPAGEIPDDAARSALAFPDNEIAVLALKGDRLKEALERGLALVPRPNKGFLQVSGLWVKFDRRQLPGSRIKEIRIGPRRPGVEPPRLDADKTYKVAMPLPLAKGALGYFRVFNGVPLAASGITLSDALTRHFAAQGVISVKVGARLRDLGAPPATKP